MSKLDRPNIVLTGPPGVGKTTVGTRIAELTGREFADVSEKVARAEFGLTEADRFQDRDTIERQIITELAPMRDLVIATPSSSMLDEENVVSLLGANVYHLTADPAALLDRISQQEIVSRPEFASADDPERALQRMLDEHAPALVRFTRIDTTGLDLDQVIDALRKNGADIVDTTAGDAEADVDANRILYFVIACIVAVIIVLGFLILTY